MQYGQGLRSRFSRRLPTTIWVRGEAWVRAWEDLGSHSSSSTLFLGPLKWIGSTSESQFPHLYGNLCYCPLACVL